MKKNNKKIILAVVIASFIIFGGFVQGIVVKKKKDSDTFSDGVDNYGMSFEIGNDDGSWHKENQQDSCKDGDVVLGKIETSGGKIWALTYIYGSGTIIFWWKLTEIFENNYSYKFLVDDETKKIYNNSKAGNWTEFSCEITGSSTDIHKVEWVFEHINGNSPLESKCLLDWIQWPNTPEGNKRPYVVNRIRCPEHVYVNQKAYFTIYTEHNDDEDYTRDPDNDPVCFGYDIDKGENDGKDLFWEDGLYESGMASFSGKWDSEDDLGEWHFRVIARDDKGSLSGWSEVHIIHVIVNEPPYTPYIIDNDKYDSDNAAKTGETVTIYASFKEETADPNNDFVKYRFDWGDGCCAAYYAPSYRDLDGNTIWEETHVYDEPGTYHVRVKAKDYPDFLDDDGDLTSDWSEVHVMEIQKKSKDKEISSLLVEILQTLIAKLPELYKFINLLPSL